MQLGAARAALLAELTQCGGVLRAAAGYHAFRRGAPPGFTPSDVVNFLLTDTPFPRSVALCVEQLEWILGRLRGRWRGRSRRKGKAGRSASPQCCAPVIALRFCAQASGVDSSAVGRSLP